MTTVLALDASSSACSAAVWHAPEGHPEQGQVISRYELAPRAHTRKLLPMAEAVLAEAGIPLAHVDTIAYGRGPGAFTGIRIAAGMAQGLAYGIGCPAIAISTLSVLAFAAAERYGVHDALGVLDARMGEVYAGGFHVHHDIDGLPEMTAWLQECVCPPKAVQLPDTLPERCVGFGPGMVYLDQFPQALQSILTDHDATPEPDAAYLVRLAARAYLAGEAVSPEQAQPVYLRDNVAARSTRGPLA